VKQPPRRVRGIHLEADRSLSMQRRARQPRQNYRMNTHVITIVQEAVSHQPSAVS
jgi:hypothetical protein